MYNRTLNRPMFRRGGRAGGGIMTGVDRQGYAGEDNKQIVEKNDMQKVAGSMEMFNNRTDVEWYEVGVFDDDWKPIRFVTKNRIFKLEYIIRV